MLSFLDILWWKSISFAVNLIVTDLNSQKIWRLAWKLWNHLIYVRFQVFMAASIKTAVFWVAAPCSVVKVYRRFRGACWLHHQGDDKGSNHLWKVSKLLPNYTAQQPRRQVTFTSSFSSSWYSFLFLICRPQNLPKSVFSNTVSPFSPS
jgi:hypothetical protein